ncbi:DegT/DnrJ/EryC1/StrS aminotransferase family protein [Ornithinimicrobium sp. F0845]|uniref:DegT/DnrJ/EryC1/StrS family aminotransferase n=1 Tax=Ornithinimicrobium sp. F0845 TaxID=2926412 RepID=UPI001FF47908|nr:DegT/DnrJ/EryC1/StrS aminotransferase family protein [Ornithinimicrobium sp. F0845]MCK0112768.1 DegT/DnrJ/EryC1/StrS aminotransferase family protein [Ornithinimicrobium sp. F0845]
MPLPIGFATPSITDEDIEAVTAVLRSGWITTGPVAAQFEAELAEVCGVPRGKVTNSCSAALELALRLVGVGTGDEVITSAYTYAATINAIVHTGATPVLADCAPGSFLIDPDSVAALITPRTRAVIAVDVGGLPCDYPALAQALAAAPAPAPTATVGEAIGRIALIADAAHSLGAMLDGVPAASLVDFAALSFHAVKNLTSAEGGALMWSAALQEQVPGIYATASVLGMQGQTKDALTKTLAGQWEYDITCSGYKWNMPDVLAALGLSQLRRYPANVRRRHELARLYDEALTGVDVTCPRHVGSRHISSGHLYMVRAEWDEAQRNAVIQELGDRGIATNVHFKPIPLLSAYHWLGDPAVVVPNALRAYQQELSLPLHLALDNEDPALVAHHLADVLRQGRTSRVAAQGVA